MSHDEAKDSNKSLETTETQDFSFDTEPWNLKGELKQVWNIVWPVTLSTMCHFIIGSTDSAFLGHLNTEALGGVTLARIWMNCLQEFVYAPGYALNILCSQAIGAKNPELAGNWLQLCVVVCSVINCICVALYSLAGPILSLATNNLTEISYGTRFARWAGTWLWFGVMFSVLVQYFNAMEVVIPEVVMASFFVFVNILLNKILVFGIHIGSVTIGGIGFDGSPIATLIATFLQCVCYWFIMFKWKKYHVGYWGGWTWKSLEWSRVKTFVLMAGPMTVACGIELWGYQVVNMMTGRLPAPQTASMSILLDMTQLSYGCFSGMGIALTIRVGHLLGAGQVENCKKMVKYTSVLVMCISSILFLIMILARDYVGRIWTSDPEVLAVVSKLAPCIAAYFLASSIGWTGLSVLEGMGRTTIGAGIYAVGVWFIFVPLAILTGFHSSLPCHICWLWYSCVVGVVFKAIAVWIALATTDWYEMARIARKNAEISDEEEDGRHEKLVEVTEIKHDDSEMTNVKDEVIQDESRVRLLDERDCVRSA